MARKATRNALLAKLHILKKQLAMVDDHYRDMLEDLTRKRSAADLTVPQLVRMVDHLTALVNGSRSTGTPHRAFTRNPGESPQMLKIKALLLAGNKPIAYGDALAKNICKVERLEWVPNDQLFKLIAALRYQAQREGWDLSGEKA